MLPSVVTLFFAKRAKVNILNNRNNIVPRNTFASHYFHLVYILHVDDMGKRRKAQVYCIRFGSKW